MPVIQIPDSEKPPSRRSQLSLTERIHGVSYFLTGKGNTTGSIAARWGTRKRPPSTTNKISLWYSNTRQRAEDICEVKAWCNQNTFFFFFFFSPMVAFKSDNMQGKEAYRHSFNIFLHDTFLLELESFYCLFLFSL